MSNISFIIVTAGNKDNSINQIIDSIEILSIPKYEVIVVGGLTTTLARLNTTHIPFNESILPTLPYLTKKKNLGVANSKYDVVVVMHDYYVFDPDWYIEFTKFGLDWDICVHTSLHIAEQGNIRANGWRVDYVPGYPELPHGMCIPWDIDCLIPYMPIQGAYWVAKRQTMIDNPLNENVELSGSAESDIEWSSRVVPGWRGQKINQIGCKIVSNPKCVTRFNKIKDTYPGNPDWDAILKYFDPLWNSLRNKQYKQGVYYYDSSLGKVFRG